MTDTSDIQEVYWEHPRWLHVVIPVGELNEPLFIAFCPSCHTHFNYYLPTAEGEGKVPLPKYGCVGPE